MNNTVTFTMNSEYAEHADIIDYFCEYDDENRYLTVYVEDVDDILINNMKDDELCEFFGLESEFLVYTNRRDLL